MDKLTKVIGVILSITFFEMAALAVFTMGNTDFSQDAVMVNEILKTVEGDWGNMKNHVNRTEADYVVLDQSDHVIYRTARGLSERIHEAVRHRDTILYIGDSNTVCGRIFIYNDTEQQYQKQKQMLIGVFAGAVLLQCIVCTGYMWYFKRRFVKPFYKLRGLAERIAQGNLDIPLEMDRYNIFGAFTESFDIMRAELKRARIAEAEANAGKKELIARLSHDIKTPVASIKAASEVGCAIAGQDRIRDIYIQIIQKADWINTLITNLFTATLEELHHLPVVPGDMESGELQELLENADYLHRADRIEIPVCLLWADKLRLQQVFDNIFANSYKYADTRIDISAAKADGALWVCIEDHGGGVLAEDLPLLKEKYKRGSNTSGTEGAGLGLFISEWFLKEMGGALILENGNHGLQVTVQIMLSGTLQ